MTVSDKARPDWKLASIEHMRCGEWRGEYTIVWVPGDWTYEQFRTAVSKAETAYLSSIPKAIAEPPASCREYSPYHGKMQDWMLKHPGYKVSTLAKQWEAMKVEYDAWQESTKIGQRRFSDFLVDQGCEKFWPGQVKNEGGYNVKLDWGHMHGTPLDWDSLHGERWPKVKQYVTVDWQYDDEEDYW